MALDIVEIFQNYCTDNDYVFSYGEKKVLNLTRSTSGTAPNKVHLLLDKIKGDTVRPYMSIDKMSYKGYYFLVLPDDRSTHVYNENSKDVVDSKYENKVKPLIPIFK